MATSGRWTREELLAALHLYHRLPFGRLHARNPEVIDLATRIRRTPSAIALKLANFAALDPSIDRRGMGNYSNADSAIWREFEEHPEDLVIAAERAVEQFGRASLIQEAEATAPPDVIGAEREALVRLRVNQSYFRRLVLARYEGTCCITGLRVPELLVAAHIVPWAQAPALRMNAGNGLCLNALHDRAFEVGLVTIDDDLRIRTAPRLSAAEPSAATAFVLQFDGAPLRLPEHVEPNREFLRMHRERFAA